MASTYFPIAVCVLTASLLSACSNADVPKAAAAPVQHGVFISTSDCADADKVSADLCGQAIDMAVTAHREQAPIYKSLRQCEAAEGPERCDKTGESEYRARIQAFFVTLSDQPTAVPLYPPQYPGMAFRSPSKQTIDARDESLIVSPAAMLVAHDNAKLPAPQTDGGAALGAAASDIH